MILCALSSAETLSVPLKADLYNLGLLDVAADQIRMPGHVEALKLWSLNPDTGLCQLRRDPAVGVRNAEEA